MIRSADFPFDGALRRGPRAWLRFALASAALLTAGLSTPLHAQTGGRTLQLTPGSSFKAAVESLLPGDTLIIQPGTYSDSGRISIGVRGTAGAPVVIKGADGQPRPVITRPGGAAVQNTINIEGATYVTLKGLEIVGNGGDGVNMNSNPSFIVLEDLDIHDVDVGVNFRSSMDNITVRHTQIRNTGIGGGTGEGMYVGCNDATCIVSNSLIENNWIHDALPGTTQGDGIEVKVGSHSNVIRNNVIYNRPYPGIFVYGTGANPVNVVEGNVIWNCLEGIYAVADAVVRNNIVIASGTGLSLYSHVQVAQMKNVTAVNNTLYDNTDGVYVRWGSGVSGMVLANNAIYSPGKSAVNAGASFAAGTTVRSNYVQGSNSIGVDGSRFLDGGSASTAFVDAANKVFWPPPGSILVGRGSAGDTPSSDFNAATRAAPFDVGAYETDGVAANPGWRIVEGFKVVGSISGGGGGGGTGDVSPPSVALNAPPSPGSTVSGSITLTASAADNVGVAGVQLRIDGVNVGSELASTPYSLAWDTTSVINGTHSITAVARDAAGNITTSAPITVTVNNSTPTVPPTGGTGPATDGGGGGGCAAGYAHRVDPTLPSMFFLALALVVLRAARRPQAQVRRPYRGG